MTGEAWILIFYLGLGDPTQASDYSGGPATAEFADLKSCEQAALSMRNTWPAGGVTWLQFKGHVCVPKKSK